MCVCAAQSVRDGWPLPGGYGLLEAGATWSEPVQVRAAIKHVNHRRRNNFPQESQQANTVTDATSGKSIIRDSRPQTAADTSFTAYSALTAGLHARGYFADTWMAMLWQVPPGSNAVLTTQFSGDSVLSSSNARRTHAPAVSTAIGGALPGARASHSHAATRAVGASAVAFQRLGKDQLLHIPPSATASRSSVVDLGSCQGVKESKTFECWVRLTEDPRGRRVALLVCDRGDDQRFGSTLWTDGQRLGLSTYTLQHRFVESMGAAPMAVGEWHHIAMRTDEEGGQEHEDRAHVLLDATVVVKCPVSPWFRNQCTHSFLGDPWNPSTPRLGRSVVVVSCAARGVVACPCPVLSC